MSEAAYVHPTALVDSDDVGAGTKIWAFVHVLKGAHVGKDCQLCDFSAVSFDARVGDGVTLKEWVGIGQGSVIEDGVFCAPYAVVVNDASPRSRRLEGVPEVARRYADTEGWLRPSRVCRGASLGTKSVVGPGLVVGEFAMVGMGSVVFRDVPAHGLVLGNPARRVGWVCFCGMRLVRAREDAPLACAACEREFETTEAGLLAPRDGAGA